MMWEVVKARLFAIEDLLRIDRDGRPEVVTRCRAVYGVAGTVSLLQLFNVISTTAVYGFWGLHANIGLCASFLLAGATVLLRWNKNFDIYAWFTTALTIGAISLSASREWIGINTTLVPFICLGPVIVGYIGSWRHAIIFGVIGFATLSWLYALTLSGPNFDAEAVGVFTFQRYMQSVLGLTMGTLVGVNFSYNTYASLGATHRSMRRAQRAEAAKSEFLATMSHELRTPLNGVIGMAEALSAAPLAPEHREKAETIRRSGENLVAIIGDLLDLAKIEAGKLTLDEQPFSPRNLVNHAAETWQAAATAKNLSVTATVDDALPETCLGDRHRLGQVLNNLISNAIKFTEHGGVSVHAEIDPDAGAPMVRFTISDTGRGIPPELHDQIFEAFEQGEGGTTRRFGGTGLGLQICRVLAEIMGGSIWLARSNTRGSVFCLAVPLPETQAERERAPSSAEVLIRSSVLAGLRVLVAEDNEVNQLVMREFLTAWGCDPVFAGDGPSTLEALEADRFDILLLDKHMPGMNGLEVARRIRGSQKAWRTIPIVTVTADTLSGEAENARQVGIDAFVPKPVRPHILRETMETLVSRAQNMDAASRA
ncbi:MAG: ATP-binding protein [Pseudomonadota bacterium]